jgi:peptidoglycan/xylan/chitin deacetylase (PgdA/CDA1 family)
LILKKCIILSFCPIFLIVSAFAGFNILVDPFGVFGDKIFNWPSYNITNTPQISKISYLENHYQEYDSYILGSSTSSSYSVDLLNKYMDAKFYNLFTPDCNMYDISSTATYVIENYNVKNLVLNIDLRDTLQYTTEPNNLYYKTNHRSFFKFYLKYLFANPKYSLDKIEVSKINTDLPQYFDLFNARTGAYDKSIDDVSSTGSLQNYLAKNTSFAKDSTLSLSMDAANEYLDNITKIKALCDQKGINLTLIASPTYSTEKEYYNVDQIKSFWSSLASISNFWDFTFSSASKDPRYFYDATHFRSALGNMVLAKIFNDSSVYTPKDLGYYVTAENVTEHIHSLDNKIVSDTDSTKNIAVLMYHHISAQGDGAAIISEQAFENQIKTIHEAGYTAVSFNQLIDYVERGINLPEKSVVITFDDGYLSNYEIAYPILKKYNLNATIFVIGSFVGMDTYKGTDYKITPHFNYKQAEEMIASGLISIQSHTYDMHQSSLYEATFARQNVLKLDNEDENDYIRKFSIDFGRSKSEIEENLKTQVNVFAYPNGLSTTLNQVLLKQMGVKCTLTTNEAVNTIVKGLPQSLFGLNRYNISDKVSAEQLLKIINTSNNLLQPTNSN